MTSMNASRTPSTTQDVVPGYSHQNCLSWYFNSYAWSKAPGSPFFIALESPHIPDRSGHSCLEGLLRLFIDLRKTIHEPSNQRSRNLGLCVGHIGAKWLTLSIMWGEGKSQHCIWTRCMAGCCADCICPAVSHASQATANTQSVPVSLSMSLNWLNPDLA